jgi:hypothetical protein
VISDRRRRSEVKILFSRKDAKKNTPSWPSPISSNLGKESGGIYLTIP